MAASSDSPGLGGQGGVQASSASESPSAAGPAQPTEARPASVRPAGPPGSRPGSTPSTPPEPARRGRWVIGLLALALVLALLWGFSQGRYAEQLAAEVAGLEGELSQVGAERDALRAHLDRVREGVDDVTGRMLTLRELAHADPMAAAQDGDEAIAPDTDASGPDAANGDRDVEAGEVPLENPAIPPAAVDF